MELPVALITGVGAVERHFAEAAPNAQVAPHVERRPHQRTRGVRLTVARGLIRAARVIAPPDLVAH